MSKSAFFEGEWVTLSANYRQKGPRPPNMARNTNHFWGHCSMPYQFAMAYANISSLYMNVGKIKQKKFFRKIVNNPDNLLFDLSPPPPHDAVIL